MITCLGKLENVLFPKFVGNDSRVILFFVKYVNVGTELDELVCMVIRFIVGSGTQKHFHNFIGLLWQS